MKIFYDASALCRNRTGIESVTYNLLLQLLATDTRNEYHIVFRKHVNSEFLALKSDRFRFYISPFKSQILTEQIYIPWVVFKCRPDISAFICFPPGLLIKKNIALYCHDATNWRYKKYLSWKNRLYFKPLTGVAMKRAKMILTNSLSSQSEILKFFPRARNIIHVIYPALARGFNVKNRTDESSSNLLVKLGITKKYILCVGSLEPRKNIEFIIRSICAVLERNDLQLVLAGRKAWGNNSIDVAINESHGRARFVKTGYVSESQLNTLYCCAEMFLYPSLYEGFGLPLLEAFSCGCPVITSNVSSMPEIAKDAALLINPTDKDELICSVESLLFDVKLRTELKKRGARRVEIFSWENSAHKFINLIETT